MDEQPEPQQPPPHQQVNIEFAPMEIVPVKVKLNTAKLRKRAELAEAKMLSNIGAQVVQVKNKALALIGDDLEKLGIKKIGHGKIAVASHNAENLLSQLGAYVEHLMTKTDADPEKIAALIALQRDFNRQLMDAGEMHIKASSVGDGNGKADHISVPFPAGSKLAVAIGPPHSTEVKQIEETVKPP